MDSENKALAPKMVAEDLGVMGECYEQLFRSLGVGGSTVEAGSSDPSSSRI